MMTRFLSNETPSAMSVLKRRPGSRSRTSQPKSSSISYPINRGAATPGGGAARNAASPASSRRESASAPEVNTKYLANNVPLW